MARKSFVFLIVGIMVLFLCSVSSAVVPDKINYQGKLTTPAGGLVNDTVPMSFSIYPDTLGSPADWTETKDSVIVEEGIFNVLLGSDTPIPASVFDGSTKYLGVQVESDPEMRPLKPMVSVPYAYRAGSGGGELDCYDCDTVFVNIEGPDSVVASTGSAFLGKASGSSTGELFGVRGYADNSSSGNAYGGYFSTSSSGTGTHYGITGEGYGSSSNFTYGSYGYAENTSSGPAFGGCFYTSSEGTGSHIGVRGNSYASSAASAIGCQGFASNTSTGYAYGSSCYASNTSTGNAYGGYFETSSFGTGYHYGVKAEAYGTAVAPTYGSYGYAENTSTGAAYGGYFTTSSSGTGSHYGVSGVGYGSSDHFTFGTYGHAENTSTGTAVGCWGRGSNTSTGVAWGGYFGTYSEGAGTHIGISADGYGNSPFSTYGVNGYAQNTSSGDAYAGYFFASDTGTGTKYGVFASAPVDKGYAGYFAGNVKITDSLIVLGAKSVAVKMDDGEYRLLYCQESSENWFEDFGEGRLINGKSVIQIDPLFGQTVNTSVKYHVFLTPQDEPLTLAVANKTTASFEVIGPSSANIAFSYRIVAKRKGYENIRLAQMGKPTPEEVASEQANNQAEREEEWAKMEEQRREMKKEREKIEAENTRMEQKREQR